MVEAAGGRHAGHAEAADARARGCGAVGEGGRHGPWVMHPGVGEAALREGRQRCEGAVKLAGVGERVQVGGAWGTARRMVSHCPTPPRRPFFKNDLGLWFTGPSRGIPGATCGSAPTALSCSGGWSLLIPDPAPPGKQVRAGVWAVGGPGRCRGRQRRGRAFLSSRHPLPSLAVQRPVEGQVGSPLGCGRVGSQGRGQHRPPNSLARQVHPLSLALGKEGLQRSREIGSQALLSQTRNQAERERWLLLMLHRKDWNSSRGLCFLLPLGVRAPAPAPLLPRWGSVRLWELPPVLWQLGPRQLCPSPTTPHRSLSLGLCLQGCPAGWS